jgi:hypothetical protein
MAPPATHIGVSPGSRVLLVGVRYEFRSTVRVGHLRAVLDHSSQDVVSRDHVLRSGPSRDLGALCPHTSPSTFAISRSGCARIDGASCSYGWRETCCSFEAAFPGRGGHPTSHYSVTNDRIVDDPNGVVSSPAFRSFCRGRSGSEIEILESYAHMRASTLQGSRQLAESGRTKPT